MRSIRRVFSFGVMGCLTILLAGCFQSAGNVVEPTIAIATATPVAPPPVPTLPPQPTPQPVASSAAVASPIPTIDLPASVPPSLTPFITPIQDGGFLTPEPAGNGVATNTPGNPQATAPLFPPAGSPTSEAIATIATDGLATPTALPTDPPCTYTVQSGDTFYAIARKLKLNPVDLINANPRYNANSLQIGDVLQVPGCKAATPTGQAPAAVGTAGPQTYVIAAGDTLGRIAQRFGVTVQDLVRANNFPNENVILNIGQKIIIPAKAQ